MSFVVCMNFKTGTACVHLEAGGCAHSLRPSAFNQGTTAFCTGEFRNLGTAIQFAKQSGLTMEKCPQCKSSGLWSESLPSLDVHELFDGLSTEVIHLHAKWKIHQQLYQSNGTAWQQSGPFAAEVIRLAVEDAVILGICRLLDDKKVAGKETGTLKRLVAELGRHPELNSLLDVWQNELTHLQQASTTILEHRNNRIAHCSLSLMLTPAVTLPSVYLQSVSDCLGKISSLMNNIELNLKSAETYYSGFETMASGGDALIADILLGQRVGALFDDVWNEKLSTLNFVDRLIEIAKVFGHPGGLHFRGDEK